MKLSKEYIMALSALILVLGAVAGGYQFYYKERLNQYQTNIAQEKKLEDTLANLESIFHNTKPVPLIAEVSGKVVPLQDELARRAAFFNLKDLQQIEPIPEGKMKGFYYREEFTRIYNEFRQDAMKRFPTCYYPDTTFGAPRPDEFTGIDPTNTEIEAALRKITFGLSMMRMLMEAKAAYINDVQLWPPRPANNLCTAQVVGLSFAMTPKDLVAFLDSLRMGDRYVHVNGLSITNAYLRWPTEPPLNVQLLLTFQQSNIGNDQEQSAKADAGGGDNSAKAILEQWQSGNGGQGVSLIKRDRKEIPEPTTKWGKFVKWMKSKGLWLF